MAKISLRAYDREIEDLIEQGRRLDEAIAHCLHILRTHPKHLETYRLLGKAYLEAKRYDQAVDIFQRVLVAVPEDFVSHVGMSIIADDQAKLDDAIWHMERAFEVQPSNAAIQAELQRLFGRRDGVEPPKIRLTRGALAHMYVQGDLYSQAISEIRAVLAHDANRTDMQVLLARAYARNGQKAEASEVCSALLAISPYCLDANRLMAESLAGTPESDAAREYRRRVIELDPYAEFAQGSIFSSGEAADGAVTLQRLDYTGQPADVTVSPSMGLDAAIGRYESDETPPSWLIPASPEESGAQTQHKEESSADLPGFLRQAGWQPGRAEPTGERVDVTQAAEDESQADLGDLPDWVRALAPEDEKDRQARADARTVQADDWLRESLEPAPSSAALGHHPDDSAPAEDETPGWLKDLGAGTEEPPEESSIELAPSGPEEASALSQSGEAGKIPQAEDEGLAWLEGLAERHGARAEELITDPDARPNMPPAWTATKAVPGDAGRALHRTEPQVPPQTPTGIDAGMPPAALVPPEKSSDWINALSDQNAFQGMEQSAETEQPPILDRGDAPVWSPLEGPAVTPGLSAPADSTAGQPEAGAGREVSGEYESEVDLPDWLADLDRVKGRAAPQAAPQIPSADELPEWLRIPDEAGGRAPASESNTWRPAESRVPTAPPPFDSADMGEAVEENTSSREAAVPVHVAASGRPQPLPARVIPAQEAVSPTIPSLLAAKNELSRGNIAAALEMYGRLIRRGRSLEEIIRDLRDALYRYPVEVPIWQALGDAYMRANRLQEALDAYTKAEELLR